MIINNVHNDNGLTIIIVVVDCKSANICLLIKTNFYIDILKII